MVECYLGLNNLGQIIIIIEEPDLTHMGQIPPLIHLEMIEDSVRFDIIKNQNDY